MPNLSIHSLVIVVRVLLGLLGVLLIVVGGATTTMISVCRLPFSMFRTYVPLREAARIAWEKVEGSGIEEYISGTNQTSEQKLSEIIYHFLVQKRRIYGKRPPSNVMRLISEHELASLHPVEGENTLVSDLAADKPRYVDVAVHRKDLKAQIAFLKKLSKDVF